MIQDPRNVFDIATAALMVVAVISAISIAYAIGRSAGYW